MIVLVMPQVAATGVKSFSSMQDWGMLVIVLLV